jgi:cytochrome c-type biogenesis protein CcmH/NrfG
MLPPEGYVNDLGYRMLFLKKDVKQAIAFFEYNVSQHPKSANTWDSLAEAYVTRGDIAQAIKHYKKSLQLDPGNRNAERRLDELQKKEQTAK